MGAETSDNSGAHYFLPFGLRFFAVLADFLNAPAVGAPFEPGLRMFSSAPALMRLRLAWILAYKPRFAMEIATAVHILLLGSLLSLGLLLFALAILSGH